VRKGFINMLKESTVIEEIMEYIKKLEEESDG